MKFLFPEIRSIEVWDDISKKVINLALKKNDKMLNSILSQGNSDSKGKNNLLYNRFKEINTVINFCFVFSGSTNYCIKVTAVFAAQHFCKTISEREIDSSKQARSCQVFFAALY